MKEFTLDSNIVINASIKRKYCLAILKYFLKELRFNKCFLTPQVKRELSHFQPRISYLLLILKNKYVLKGKPIKQGFEAFLDDFENKKDKNEFKKFSNIIDYLEERKVDPNNIERFSSAIVSAIGRLIARDIPVKPTEENRRQNTHFIKEKLSFIKENSHVNDLDDSKIIAELMYFVSENKRQITFTTDNLKDFNYKSKSWTMDSLLKLIIILSSEEFCKKFTVHLRS